LRCRSGVSGSAAASARRFVLALRRHRAGSSQVTREWFETLRLYRDSAFAGATKEGDEGKDDRRPTALRARPPRGAQRPRAVVLRVSLLSGPGWQPAARARDLPQVAPRSPPLRGSIETGADRDLGTNLGPHAMHESAQTARHRTSRRSSEPLLT
jgi:hypothetical protein